MRIGIDLGGTKIAGIVLDDRGEELCRQRIPTPLEGYEAILDGIAGLVGELQLQVGVTAGHCAIGVGSPGALSPATDLLRNSNTTCMNGRPLLDDLRRRLGERVSLANDANCFALSEAVDGAGAGAHCVFGVIIGTGTGGGVVIDQRPLQGRHAIAGEWGHNPMPGGSEGRVCYCGRHDCVETYLCGRGLAQTHTCLTGEQFSARQIAERAEAGNTKAQATLACYSRQLAAALAVVINILDPDVVVLGGGLSNIGALYKQVPVYLPEFVFSDVVATRILPPLHGDDSGVRGAAWL